MREREGHFRATMEELRAHCGHALSAASMTATIVKRYGLSLDMDEFDFVKTTLPFVWRTHFEDRTPQENHSMAARYLVEMCDWSDVSGHEKQAVSILATVMRRIDDAPDPLCEEWERILRVFTPAVVQRIQDGTSDFNLLGLIFDEGVQIAPSLARYGLAIIPDAILFDARVHPNANFVATPIAEMMRRSGEWEWDILDEFNRTRTAILDFLTVCIERMPEYGFLSKRVKVAPGKYQYVLHAILGEITEIHQHFAADKRHFVGPISEVLRLLFQTPKLMDDIWSIKNETSYHCFRMPIDSKMEWHGLTLEDMIHRRDPSLLPIFSSTTAKGAFDE